MNTMEQYMQVSNLKRLVEIFQGYVRSRYNTDVDTFKVREMFLKAMTSVMPQADGMTLQELNKHTLQVVTSAIKTQLMTTPPAAPAQAARIPPGSGDASFEEPVDQALAREMASRGAPPPGGDAPSGVVETFQPHAQQASFMDRRLQDTIDINPPDDILSSATPAGGARTARRADPLAMLRKNLRIDMENFESAVSAPSDPYFAVQTGLPFHPNQLKQTFLTIHSADRNWVRFPNRYEYLVRFTFGEPTVRRVPVHANNPTVPFTRSVNSSGIPNLMGFYLDNATFYPGHDASKPPGDVVGYEDVREIVDNNAHIHSQPTNIVCIRISSVVIPMNRSTVGMRGGVGDYSGNGMPFPYVQLGIDELSQVYDGTNEVSRRAFCQLAYKSHFYTSNGRGYVRLEPMQQEFKLFMPTFLSTLPSLTIRMTTPYGDLLQSDQDGIAVRKIEYSNFNEFYLKVILTKYFDAHAFRTGDVVRFSNYCMYKAFPDQNTAHVAHLNEYVNRIGGHDVMEIGEPNSSGYFNSFFVRAPGKLDADTGSYEIDQCLVKQIVVYNSRFYSTLADPASLDESNGTVMNLSMQNVVMMRIDSAAQDVSGIVSEAVH